MAFDFFDDFNNFFGKAWSNFSRPVKDMYPYTVYKIDNKRYIVACNTLGISKDDLKVGVETNKKGSTYPVLRIKGSTKFDKQGVKFDNNVDLGINLEIDPNEAEVEDVKYEVKDGITIVYLKLKLKQEVPDSTNIQGSYLDDKGSTDW